MISFLIYLFESGMCLTLLFLVYYFFLRKETYFTFNRFYLITILILSFLLPLLHLNLTLPDSKQLEGGVDEINRLKNYYENLIALTDPDYENSFTKAFQENSSNEFEEGANINFSGPQNVQISSEKDIQKIKTGFWAEINWAQLLLIIYLLGMLFFTARLLLLFRWLKQAIKKYGSTAESGINLVKMDEEVPPFSFFRFVFLNRETTSHSGFSQILTHEKVHISQRHSYDLLLAHAITIFQWFNPFVWLINKAMKTNHEYIADRNVIDQGNELFDYQSLLLKQIISIRSVELVNNFNLINIKKRIAMMTKIKSGLAAQIKALVVIPAAIFLFLFFAEISFAQEDVIGFEGKDLTNELQGFWENEDNSTYGQLLNFKDNKLQILENIDTYRELEIQFMTGSVGMVKDSYYKTEISKHTKDINELSGFMTLPLVPHKSRGVNLIYKKDKLIVGWSNDQVSIYKRDNTASSVGCLSKADSDFKPVATSYYRVAENPDKTYFLFMNNVGQMFVDGEHVESIKFIEKVKEVKRKGTPFGADEKIPVLVVDARCEMAFVNVMFRKLREMDELRHILSVKPFDEKVPEILYHNVGIPRLFPLKEGTGEMTSFEEIEKSNLKVIRVDLAKTKSETDNSQLQEIKEGEDYAILYTYKNKTTFKEYMNVLDEVYSTIHQKRNVVAQKRYNLDYDDLAGAQQKEIRKIFPLVLVEKNVDWVDYR